MNLSTAVKRGVLLRCPACGKGKLFQGWFRMHADCAECRTRFDREPGYFLGSIYFNYGVTAVLIVGAYFTLYFSDLMQPKQLLWTLGVFCFVFPAWFFRYARSLWLAFDHYFDPAERR